MSFEDLPLISVIITVYNLKLYVEKAIKSVCNQTYKNLQIIVIDDGSTDGSSFLCDKMAQCDERIIVHHQANAGSGAAKNAGLLLAKGEYIGFVDGDDYINPEMYITLIQACMEHDADIAWCGRKLVNENGDYLYDLFSTQQTMVYSGQDYLKKLISWDGCDSATWDKLFKRGIWDGVFFQENVSFDDLVPSIETALKVKSAVHVNGALYYYLQRKTGICKQPFAEKKMSMCTEAIKVQNLVIAEHPEFTEMAKSFVTHYIRAMVSQAYNSSALSLKLKKQILGMVFSHWKQILFEKQKIQENIRMGIKLCLLLFRINKQDIGRK